MTAPFLSVEGRLAQVARLYVPPRGRWFVDVDFPEPVSLSGLVTVAIGGLELVGTVDAAQSGTFQLGTQLRVVTGAGWESTVAAKHFHNDAGVKASHVVKTIAAEVGEKLGAIPDRVLGVDFVRGQQTAARVLDRLFPAWWVDYSGVTQLSARADADPGEVVLLGYSPRDRVAELTLDEPAALFVGAVLRHRLDRPLRVRSFELRADGQKLRAQAWGEELAA